MHIRTASVQPPILCKKNFHYTISMEVHRKKFYHTMQNEKYFYGRCNEFEYNHDYEKLEYKYIYISMYMCESIFRKLK